MITRWPCYVTPPRPTSRSPAVVLDGQQRLKTFQAFYKGVFRGKVFSLENVADEYRGLTYDTLDPEQRRSIDNTFIQATIVRTDGTRESLDSIYQVFERLNSGGTQLTAHEIRIALYPGEMIDYIAELNNNPSWRNIYGKPSPRLRDHELILRIFALYSREDMYLRPLKKFLNEFVRDFRNLERFDVKGMRDLFESTGYILNEAGVRSTVRRAGQRVNAAMLEAVFVGAMRAVASGAEPKVERLAEVLTELEHNPDLDGATSGSTANEEYLHQRLQISTDAFSEL